MQSKNWTKFPVLFGLYIAQSVPMSFFSTVVPVIMRQQNYSLESIGLLQLVKLPWILKFLWAPLIDNKTRNSRDLRKWIIASELFYAIIIFSIAFFNLQTDFKLIVSFMVIAFVASATQDIATDAFAILILKKSERSIGNSMQSAGSFIGSLLGTGVLLIAYYYFGWQTLLFLLASFVLVALIPLQFYKRERIVSKPESQKVSMADIWKYFRLPGMHKRLLILIFFYSGIIGILAMLKPYLVDLGYNVKEIGIMSGIFGTAVAAGSAFIAGLLIKKIGVDKAMYVFILVSLSAAIYMLFISFGTPAIHTIYIGITLIWGAYGLSTVAIYTSSMNLVRSGREGTDFTLQIVITHMSGILFAVLSGKIADLIGYSGLFAVESTLCIATLIILFYALNGKRTYEDTFKTIE